MEKTCEDDESVVVARLLIKRDVLLGKFSTVFACFQTSINHDIQLSVDDCDNTELTKSSLHEAVELPVTEEIPQYAFVNGGNSVSSDDDYTPHEYSLKL